MAAATSASSFAAWLRMLASQDSRIAGLTDRLTAMDDPAGQRAVVRMSGSAKGVTVDISLPGGLF
jgi:hypothetical protein